MKRGVRSSTAPPAWAIALSAVAVAFFGLPLIALASRAPWSRTLSILTSEVALDALRLSLVCSAWATMLSIALGIPLAWLLARTRFPGRSAVLALCTVSMVLPPVVGGVALLFALGRRGLVGRHLWEWFGVQIPFSTVAVVLAQTFVAMPFLVVTVESALSRRDRDDEDAARTLGSSAWRTFREVTLPAIRPAVTAGIVLAWARALGEFGATVTFAGSLPGVTRTMPLTVYTALESDPEAAITYSLLMVVVSFAVILGLRDRWWSRIANDERSRG